MKKCLIVVDYQNDFINGALGFPKALTIKNRIEEKIRAYHENGNDVIFTLDTHHEDYITTEEGKNLPVIHCVKGTKGHNLYPDVMKLTNDSDLFFEKPTFPSLELGNHLHNKNYKKVELCGLVSNICVISNAVIAKSALPNAHIVVDALATASFDEKLNSESLDVLEGLHVEVINR